MPTKPRPPARKTAKPAPGRSKAASVRIAVPPPKAPRSRKPPPADDKPSPDLPHLTPTDDPDVFRNASGGLVDKYGVLLALRAYSMDEPERGAKLIGGPVDSPAKLLKMVALDPLMPLVMRIDAAKAAAPYFDKKTPVAVESKNEDFTLDLAAVAALPRQKRIDLLKILGEMGVNLGGAQ
jgi:hypothetical protein